MVVGLILWVEIDNRVQRRQLKKLARAGVTRRPRESPHERRLRQSDSVKRRRLVVLLPLIVFLGLAALFLYRLGAGDPSMLPPP